MRRVKAKAGAAVKVRKKERSDVDVGRRTGGASAVSSLAARLRKLATDCRQCRHGFCCGQCLCCVPEGELRALVREAKGEAAITHVARKRR